LCNALRSITLTPEIKDGVRKVKYNSEFEVDGEQAAVWCCAAAID
jgi:hypothetical protein